MSENHLKKYSEAGFLPSVGREDASKLMATNIQFQPIYTGGWLNQFVQIQWEGFYPPVLDFKYSSEREKAFFIQKIKSQSRLLLAFLTRPSCKSDQGDKKADSFSQSGNLNCKCANPVRDQVESPGNQITLTIKVSNNTNSKVITKE